jgi:glycosyltransferase involved in cell wall biosynthesis
MPGLAVGGAERHTIDLRARLAARGYSTAVIVHSDVVSATMHAMPGAEDAEILSIRGAPSLAAAWRAYRAFKAADADIIFAVNHMRAIWAVLLRAMGATKASIVCVCHTTSPLAADERRLPLFRLVARFIEAMVYVSRNQLSYWTARHVNARRSLAIVNGVDLERYSVRAGGRAEAKRRLGLAPDDYVAGLLASFRPEKNHLQLVEVAAQLDEGGLPVKLLFVGDGPTRRMVEERVEALGLAGSVIFAGEHADVRPIIAAFDVGVLCSTEVETFSLAALELLASDVPMIMSNVGGASEIVQEGVNGFLFEKGDTPTLKAHLQALAEPIARALFQSRARESVVKYSIDVMTENYVRLIETLKPQRPGGGD